jgi:hypothetical protein
MKQKGYNVTYDEWADSAGILKDEESREAWNYQQAIIDKLLETIESLKCDLAGEDL